MPDKKDLLVVPFSGLETKEIQEKGAKFFEFEGYLSTFNNTDLVGDVVLPGAFQESLQEKMPKLLWMHNWEEPIGVFIEAKEDDKGLFVKGKMPLDDDFVKGRVVPQLRAGSIDSMSIGFYRKVTKYDEETGIRYLVKVELIEGSLVTFPANTRAKIEAIKAMKKSFQNRDENAVPGIKYHNEFAPIEHHWEPEKAKARVDESRIDIKEFGDLNIFDVIDEKIVVVPRALFCLKAQIIGAKGGYDGDEKTAKSIINKYYEKMNLEAPFCENTDVRFSEHELKNMPVAEVAYIFRKGKLSKSCSDTVAKWFLSSKNEPGNPDVSDFAKLGTTVEDIKKHLKKL